MDPITGASSDVELARLVEANWEALEADLVGRFYGTIEDDSHIFRFRTNLPSGFLNGVLRTDVAPETVDDLARESRAWFPADLPWRWVVGPTSRPLDLADRLEVAGLERRWPLMPAMAVDLEALDLVPRAPAGGRVTEVLDAQDVESWLGVRHVNLGLDDRTVGAWRRAHGESGLGPESPLRHFVGWLGDRPVAGATLYVGAGAAGIYHVDTLLEARGRGFASALTATALHEAERLGYRWGVLSASTLGTPVYLGLGFRIVGNVTVLVGGAH
jgi:predicted GNAT family acetyltransferase